MMYIVNYETNEITVKIENKIRREILINMLTDEDLSSINLNTDDEVECQYELAEEGIGVYSDYDIYDDEYDFRCSGEEVNIKGLEVYGTRHYEAKRVARKLSDGEYVSWIYWFGGGKHRDLVAIDWMREEDGACMVNCVEEDKIVTVRTYSKLD